MQRIVKRSKHKSLMKYANTKHALQHVIGYYLILKPTSHTPNSVFNRINHHYSFFLMVTPVSLLSFVIFPSLLELFQRSFNN